MFSGSTHKRRLPPQCAMCGCSGSVQCSCWQRASQWWTLRQPEQTWVASAVPHSSHAFIVFNTSIAAALPPPALALMYFLASSGLIP